MNKRFMELAEQAGYERDLFGVGHWEEPECRKLAELIVQECAQVCNDIDSEYEEEDVLATWCAKAIRDHFGIGE